MAFRRHRKILVISAVALAGWIRPAAADSFVWQGGDGNWDDLSHWVGGLGPTGAATDQVVFDSDVNTVVTSAHDPWIINGLTITAPNSPLLSASNAQGIEFAGVNPFIVHTSIPGFVSAVTISAPVILSQVVTYSDPAEQQVGYALSGLSTTFSGPVSGAGGLEIQSGAAALTGTNTFTGGVTVHGDGYGAVLANSGQSFGTGPVSFNSGTGATNLVIQSDVPLSFANDFSVQGTANYMTVEPVAASSAPSLAFNRLTFGTGNSVLIANTPGISTNQTLSYSEVRLQGNGTLVNAAFASVVIGAIHEDGGSFSMTFGDSSNSTGGVVTLGGASAYSGGTTLENNVTVNANVANALGTGPVTMAYSSVLNLNATNAANNGITGQGPATQVFYNANGAAGGHLVSAGSLVLAPTVTSFIGAGGSDSFGSAPGGLIVMNTAQLAMLDRTTNFQPGAGTTLFNTDGTIPDPTKLGTAGDLLIGMSASLSSNLTLGTGTPWGGLDGLHTGSYSGTLTINAPIMLKNETALGSATPGSFAILPALGASPQDVTLNQAAINASGEDFSGVDTFIVTGLATLGAAKAMGGGGASTARPMEVTSLGALSLGNSAAVNGSVHFDGGSTLVISAAGLTGTGAFSRDNEAMSFDLRNAGALTGAQMGTTFIQAGDLVIVEANDITNISLINPAANFLFSGTSRTEAEGLNLNGGVFTLSAALQPSGASGASNVVHVGSLGETFIGTGTSAGLPIPQVSAINVPIVATGPLAIGTPNSTAGSGGIFLGNTGNSIGSITVYSRLAASNPAELGGASIALQGGTLQLYSDVRPTFPPLPPVIYSNPLIVHGGTGVVMSSAAGTLSAIGGLSSIDLGNGSLTISAAPFQIGSLNLSGKGAIGGVSNLPLTVASVTETGGSQGLDLNGGHLVFPGSVSITGPIAIKGGTGEFDGTVAASASGLLLTNSGSGGATMLMGKGVIHRDVGVGDFCYVSPGGGSDGRGDPETLTVNSLSFTSGATAEFDLGAPNVIGGSTDLVVVNGDLTLAGNLFFDPGAGFGAGMYTLFTYSGGLTNNGMGLLGVPSGYTAALDFSSPGKVALDVTAVPEPAAIACLAPLVPMLLRRRKSVKWRGEARG